ncbi:MAG: hypothetical protein Q4G28_00675 [Neisseria sp.]|nr:hypothetical protein [Neisseria sp.]
MKKILTAALLAACGSTAFADTCTVPQAVEAAYTVTEYDSRNQPKSYPLKVIRSGDIVAYQYPASQLIDIWTRGQGGQLSLTRYFDAHKRGIEYYAGDLRSLQEHKGNHWPKLAHVVDVSALTPKSRSGSGCKQIERYQSSGYRVDYLSAYQLPENMTFYLNGKRSVSYRLEKIGARNDFDGLIAGYRNYPALDFADIGDSEADPFVRQMIKMGFIEHHHENDGHQH